MKYILIAEDDPDITDALCQILTERLDVDCDVVANGVLVMDSIAARCPDLLILDVSLSGLNGLDVFDLLRSDLHWEGLSVLFLTGLPERAAIRANRRQWLIEMRKQGSPGKKQLHVSYGQDTSSNV